MKSKGPNIILFDIETSLMKVELPTFSLKMGNPYINHKHLKQDFYVISVAWKRLGDKKVKSVSVIDSPLRFSKDPKDDTFVLNKFRDVLDSADMVVAHNGKRFDMKKLNARFIEKGLKPLHDIPVYDTLTILKKVASFTSNRLDFIAPKLGYKGKIESEGLWQKIYNKEGNDVKAIKAMVKYNKNDVDILEYVYNYIKPYGPSLTKLMSEDSKGKAHCKKCGSKDVIKNGTKMLATGKHQTYRCNKCGGVTKGEKV